MSLEKDVTEQTEVGHHFAHDWLPCFEMGTTVPKIIHQVFFRKNMPEKLMENARMLRSLNPGWEYKLYDDRAATDFITNVYGSGILEYMEAINPRYGAAKADLFRYLLLYKYGGVYLDIKSTCRRPLDQIILKSDRFLLAHWNNLPGGSHIGWGMVEELKFIDRGEYQQWHIIVTPGHPYLRAVIEAVLANIKRYDPVRDGTGRLGVLRLTGPFAYTKAIHPLVDEKLCRIINTEDVGLEYSIFEAMLHKNLFDSHYSFLSEPIAYFHSKG